MREKKREQEEKKRERNRERKRKKKAQKGEKVVIVISSFHCFFVLLLQSSIPSLSTQLSPSSFSCVFLSQPDSVLSLQAFPLWFSIPSSLSRHNFRRYTAFTAKWTRTCTNSQARRTSPFCRSFPRGWNSKNTLRILRKVSERKRRMRREK